MHMSYVHIEFFDRIQTNLNSNCMHVICVYLHMCIWRKFIHVLLMFWKTGFIEFKSNVNYGTADL